MPIRVPAAARWLLAPATAELTYRRFVHLLLGAVVLLPYLALGFLFATSVLDGGLDPVAFVLLLVLGAGIGFGVAVAPGVRTLEVAAARALLGATVADVDPDRADTWPVRLRGLLWLLVVVVAGGVTALLTLTVVPLTIGLLLAPWVRMAGFPTGWAAAWMPVVGLALPVVLLRAVASAGAGLARLAPRLIGPSPAELLAVELERARSAERTLAERNRLARELHDSVGHALTVTTLQAGAAARVLDSDPAFVTRALDAIAEAGRTALDELDHVLGLLRDGEGAIARRVAQPDLGDLDALLASTRATGVDVAAQVVSGPVAVPPAVSREAYRIVQEGLTNALRHAGPVPVTVRVATTADAVELLLTNPVDPAPGTRTGGGRGLAGMRERVGVLRGELTAGLDGPLWRVAVRLPLDGRG
ncbi:sensor histidine kinase [Pseudonocardia sp. GCM10023141]|uniref:sensor histidine kinase n=1 Tax=Pseudonocardia sp. GCM10023141 TaxID=3252653 RepID=UPI003608E195